MEQAKEALEALSSSVTPGPSSQDCSAWPPHSWQPGSTWLQASLGSCPLLFLSSSEQSQQ